METKQIGIFVGIVALLLGGLYFVATMTQPGGQVDVPDGVEAAETEIEEEDIVRGNTDANVVLTKYSDFQCPACRSAYPIVKAAVDELEDEVAFVYRHFPLPQFQHNRVAAAASEAAARQGAFWEMHDMIFDGQDQWSRSADSHSIFIQYAEDLDLDIEQFVADMDDEDIHRKIERDRVTAEQKGVRATPTFTINGERIENPGSYDNFISVLEDAIEENN